MSAMDEYTAYGLTFASEIQLPELLPASPRDASRADDTSVTIRLGATERIDPPPNHPPLEPLMRARRGEALLHYPGAASFHVSGGRFIVIDIEPGADPSVVRLFLLGPVLAVLLHQRGLLVLHASAAAIDGRVAVFAAEKGEGKSTLTAALHARGHALVSDDLVPLDPRDPKRILVPPGFPQLKLMPEAAAQLADDPHALPRVHPDYEKRAHRTRENFADAPLPLAAIFLLETASEDAVEPVAAQRRFIELVRHSYLAGLLPTTGESADHFRQVAALVERVPVLRLKRRRRLDALPETVRMIETELARC